MWSSGSASLHHHAILNLHLLPKTPKASLHLVSDPRFSAGVPIFSAAKQGGRLAAVAAAAKSAGSKDSAAEQKWTNEGQVTESLPNGMFRIRLDNSDMIIGYISGKIRKSFIRILPGDRVKVEVSRYDSTRGRIVYRLRSTKDPA